MNLSTESLAVAEYAQRRLNLTDARLSDEYRYQSLPLCVIDAVFSIGVRYSSTREVVIRYCRYASNQKRIRADNELPPLAEQEPVGRFCDRPEQADASVMADQVYQNRQRTSTKNGILKAEATARFARCLRSHGVEYLQDVSRVAASERFEADIRAIPGQASGISLQYFWMLAGSDQFIKPDRMVLRFLETCLSRTVRTQEASDLLRNACLHLAGEYPKLTPRLLDHEVWKYQRSTVAIH